LPDFRPVPSAIFNYEIKLMDIVHGGSITDHIRALLRLHMTSGSGAKAARGNPNAH